MKLVRSNQRLLKNKTKKQKGGITQYMDLLLRALIKLIVSNYQSCLLNNIKGKLTAPEISHISALLLIIICI